VPCWHAQWGTCPSGKGPGDQGHTATEPTSEISDIPREHENKSSFIRREQNRGTVVEQKSTKRKIIDEKQHTNFITGKYYMTDKTDKYINDLEH
jgi:hypothetical protein